MSKRSASIKVEDMAAVAGKKPRVEAALETVPAAAAAASSTPPVAADIPIISSSALKLSDNKTGSGRFGDVYQAVRLDDGESAVAVKKMRGGSKADIAAFRREAAILSRLPYHEHVLQLLGVVEESQAGRYWLVTQWMSNGSMSEYLQRAQPNFEPASQRIPLSWSQKLNMSWQCARAISFLHLPSLSGPVILRQLSSSSFLVDKDGNVKIADVGLSTSIQERFARWMAPEVLAGGATSMASNVYSLGVIIWEIFCGHGKLPYHADDDQAAINKIQSGSLLSVWNDLPAALRDSLEKLLHRCWKMQPVERINCAEVIGALVLMRALAVEVTQPAAAVAVSADSGVAMTAAVSSQAPIAGHEDESAIASDTKSNTVWINI